MTINSISDNGFANEEPDFIINYDTKNRIDSELYGGDEGGAA